MTSTPPCTTISQYYSNSNFSNHVLEYVSGSSTTTSFLVTTSTPPCTTISQYHSNSNFSNHVLEYASGSNIKQATTTTPPCTTISQYYCILYFNKTVATMCWTPYQEGLLLQQAHYGVCIRKQYYNKPSWHKPHTTPTQTMEYVSESSTTTSFLGMTTTPPCTTISQYQSNSNFSNHVLEYVSGSNTKPATTTTPPCTTISQYYCNLCQQNCSNYVLDFVSGKTTTTRFFGTTTTLCMYEEAVIQQASLAQQPHPLAPQYHNTTATFSRKL
jgi:hypothetical protein